ncbi:hypothetical protein CSKR_109511 [Clonorchis sinensis]|uniref:Uncharacterized protein n=1 Tax=Clonorchis sinensis TaxID=79923 RepID=A0A8T1MVX9_CLOSI|nr:hypothetical protein CSKR_109511 [Clonorchis sinensis]
MTNNTGGSSTQAKSHDYRVKHYKRSKTEPEYTPSDFATVNDNAISDTLCARFFYKYQVKACQKKDKEQPTPECIKGLLEECSKERQKVYNLTQEVKSCKPISLAIRPLLTVWIPVVSVLLPAIR